MNTKKIASAVLIIFVCISAVVVVYKQFAQGRNTGNVAVQPNSALASGQSAVAPDNNSEAAINPLVTTPATATAPVTEGQITTTETTGQNEPPSGTEKVVAQALEPSQGGIQEAPKTQTENNVPSSNKPKVESSTKVVAYYLHGNVRCGSCYAIENYFREAINQYYPGQIQAGTLDFQTVNVENPENRHYLQDYQAPSRSLVLTLQSDGKTLKSSNLTGVWLNLGNKQQFFEYVKGEVDMYLKEVQ